MSKNIVVRELFKPKISIVIPVYNGANYVKKAINSALHQDYSNFEVIVINDGSTDSTEEIVKSFGGKVRYYKKNSGGVSTALNLGIKMAKGEYISWLSHDDVYLPNKLSSQVSELSRMNNSNRKRTILYSNYGLINEKDESIGGVSFENDHLNDNLDSSLYPLLNGLVNGCTLLIPRNIFDNYGYFNIELKATQDYDLWYRVFPNINLKFMQLRLVDTRIHAEQTTKSLNLVTHECNILWLKMIKNLTKKQRLEVGGTEINYYSKMLKKTTELKYDLASNYIQNTILRYMNRGIDLILVSVIIPFYNRVELLESTIKSVVNQTHKNIEIILIDDYSNEDISEILNKYRTYNISYYRNDANFGAAYSRNLGIKKAKGEYIAFLDSDDVFDRKKIKTQLLFMLRNGYSISHTPYRVIPSDYHTFQYISSADNSYPSIISNCTIATPTVMVHKDIFVNRRVLFNTNYEFGEDVCLWIYLSRIYEWGKINKPLTTVRKNQKSASYDTKKQLIGTKNIYNFVLENMLDNESYRELIKLNIVIQEKILELYAKKNNGIITKIKSLLRIR